MNYHLYISFTAIHTDLDKVAFYKEVNFYRMFHYNTDNVCWIYQ